MIETNFQIKKILTRGDEAEFVIEPLEKGFGHTVGNALRRVLLTSIRGAAVTQIKVEGIRHKFSTLTGMREDIIELILNLKQLQIKYTGVKPLKLTLTKTGPGQVMAKDIETTGEVTFVNPELVLASLAKKENSLKMELVIESGVGYQLAEERKSDEIGVIPLDAAFSPVHRVDYQVETTRVGQRTDLDRLVLKVVTNGTVEPLAVVKEAAGILRDFFAQIFNPKEIKTKEEVFFKSDDLGLKLTVEELDLPIRIINALRKNGLLTVADLVAQSRATLAKVRNLGSKSVKMIEEVLAKKGLKLKKE